MKSDDPRQMKQMGKRIKGYKDTEWKRQSSNIIMECVRNKVYSHKEIQDYLLATGDKIIGEGTPDPHFGVGIHIGDSRVLNLDEWTGNNIMGKALMETRSEIKLLQGVRDEIQDPTAQFQFLKALQWECQFTNQLSRWYVPQYPRRNTWSKASCPMKTKSNALPYY